MAQSEAPQDQWLWIGGAAIATFLIASVVPTAILRAGGLACLDLFQAFGAPGYSCFAPFNGTLELAGGGLTMSLNFTAKIILALVAAGVTTLVLRRKPA